jgi:dienelactone hydrolase
MTATEMEDVITYMQRQSFVDPKNVVVLGHSWGALGALGVAYDAPLGSSALSISLAAVARSCQARFAAGRTG